MSTTFRRARPVLATLPLSDPRRPTRALLRKCTEKFFLPFTAVRRSSPDLATFHFRENLRSVLVPSIIDETSGLTSTTPARTRSTSSSAAAIVTAKQNVFAAAQFNGEVGNARMFEDFFHLMLAGFDVVHVNVENKDSSLMSGPQDPCHFCGSLILAHTRPFLGWQPSYLSVPRDHFRRDFIPNSGSFEARSSSQRHFRVSDILPFTRVVAEEVVLVPRTVRVPFSTHVEGAITAGGSRFLLSHMNLRIAFADALATPAGERENVGIVGDRVESAPGDVLRVLRDREATKIVAGLRRLGVSPELITAETLLSARQQKAAWVGALDVA